MLSLSDEPLTGPNTNKGASNMALCICISCNRPMDCSGEMLCEICVMDIESRGLNPRDVMTSILSYPVPSVFHWREV